MTQAVSLSTPNVALSKKPKSCTSRFSYPFDAKQTLALGLIASLAFLPLGAAGLALAMTRNVIPSPTPGLQTSNATCPPLQISAEAIRSYLRNGNSDAYSSAAARQIENLQLEDFTEKRYDSESTKQRWLDEKKCELLTEAAAHFLKTADSEEHPAAKALALHQAKDALKQALGLSGPNWISLDLHSRVEGLRVEEADACHESAKLTETPEEKLSWATRGLQELNIPLNPYESNTFSRRNNLPACDAAASLFYSAAQSFKQLDPRRYYDHAALVRSNQRPIFTAQTQLAAAECLKHAAYYSRNSEDAQAAFDEAIEVVKSIDTSSIPLEEQVEIQERIVSTSIAAHSAARGMHPALSARIFSESMIAEKMYQQLIKSENGSHLATYYTIQRALRLKDAADYAHNLTRSVDLYREARDIVQKAWNKSPFECRLFRDFETERFTLLDRLKELTQRVEEELARANAGIIASAWNTVRGWLT